jgi:HEAT repeat protein
VADEYLSGIAKYLKKEYSLEIRTQAAQALGALGKKSQKRINSLIKLMDDKEPVVVYGASAALVQICQALEKNDDKVIDALISLLKAKDVNRVACGIFALVNLKADIPRVHTALEKVIDTEKARAAKDVNAALIKLAQDAIKELKKPKDKK